MTTTKKKTKKNKELLRIMTGYDQHTSPSLLNENQLTNLGVSTITSWLVASLGHQP